MSNDISTLNGMESVDTNAIQFNNMMSAALAYAAKGWRVFPLGEKLKTPITEHGCKDATCDETIIKTWWANNPNANVGIATGSGSDLLVLDEDTYKGGGETLAAMMTADHGELPPTIKVITGGGGIQYYFRYPTDGKKYGNKSYGRHSWPYVGVDVRGESGYVVAPPSIHPSGGPYEFRASTDTVLADAPKWLLKLISAKDDAKPKDDAPDALKAVSGPLATLPTAVSMADHGRYRSHLIKRAAEYLSKDAGAIQGQGGDAHTFQVAGHLLALECGGERLTSDEVIKAMGEWNNRCSPPWDIAALEIKVKSAASNGTPRAIKPCSICGTENIDGWGVTASPTELATMDGKSYSPTNLGDGQLFADTFRNEVIYVSEWKRWLRWDGKRWGNAAPEVIRRYAHRLVTDIMPTIAKVIGNDDDRSKYYKHIAAAHQTFQLDAMLKEATAYLSVPASQLDADAMLFNVQNGTMDCRTADFRSPRREDFITKISPCRYDPMASCPTWLKFLERVMQDGNGETDRNMLQYLQAAMGYSLTGSVAEECIFVLHGIGRNGKSTLLELMLYCLGDYAIAMQPSVLLADKRQGGNSDDIAQLQGVRCAVAVETGDGGRLNSEKVKAITGGDRIAACRKYESPFQFAPTHKIWLATNFAPKVDGADAAIWRRIKKCPFLAVITDAELDTHLKGPSGTLTMEADGIMAWMIEGLKRWNKEGLKEPQTVKDATAKYREDSDVFGHFISECCIIDKDAHCRPKDLFQAYTTWADDMGIDFKMTAVTLPRKLQDRGINTDGRDRYGKVYKGIGLHNHRATNEDAIF